MSVPLADWPHAAMAGAGDAPVLLLLHGTGGNERDMLGVGHRLAPRAGRLAPRGRVSEAGMARYFARSPADPFLFPDFEARIPELAAFVTAAVAEHGLGGRPIVAVGYSNGANAATGLLLRAPGLLAGAVLLRGLLPAAPAAELDLATTPILVATGTADHLVPAEMTERLVTELRHHGADVTVHRTPAGHSLDASDFAAAAGWLAARF